MNSAVIHPAKDYKIVWAIIGSILVHGLLAVIIPGINLDEVKEPEVLEISLVKKEAPQPPAEPEPIQPPPPEVVPPPVQPKIKPEPKPVIKEKPSPIVQELPREAETPPPQPEVIAVKPPVERIAPTQPTPAPEPIKPPPPPTPSQADIDNATDRYGNSLWSAISKHKKYPKIAQMRGWQGETIVELELDGSGKLKSKKIIQSSGYEVLDKQALEMVDKALPFPTPPEALRNSNFTITVPVPFKLE